MLMLPLLLAMGAPVAAAIVPGALLTAAAWSGAPSWFESTPRAALPAAQVVDPDDPVEAARIARAQFVGRVDGTA